MRPRLLAEIAGSVGPIAGITVCFNAAGDHGNRRVRLRSAMTDATDSKRAATWHAASAVFAMGHGRHLRGSGDRTPEITLRRAARSARAHPLVCENASVSQVRAVRWRALMKPQPEPAAYLELIAVHQRIPNTSMWPQTSVRGTPRDRTVHIPIAKASMKPRAVLAERRPSCSIRISPRLV